MLAVLAVATGPMSVSEVVAQLPGAVARSTVRRALLALHTVGCVYVLSDGGRGFEVRYIIDFDRVRRYLAAHERHITGS